MPRVLSDMVVIITGASAGIGEALARELAHRGAKLALAARRVDRLVDLNRSLGGAHLVRATDVSDPRQCEGLIRDSAEHFGRIDTLVCNAGYGVLQRVHETSIEEMRRIFATNVYGTTDCIRPAVQLMKGQPPRDGVRGQIVIVSSVAARRGLPYFGVYSATKAAQLSLAEALRVELKAHRIAVTSVHPIGTETEFSKAARKASDVEVPEHQSRMEYQQSAATVARAIVRGIERPRPEVWPFAPYRWGVSIGTLIPSVVDAAMAARRKFYDNALKAARSKK